MAKAAKRQRGRPCLYTPELAAEIVARISSGETLHSVCESESMPAVRTVNSWGDEKCRPPEVPATFAAEFARARADGFDAIAADTLTIADDDTRDWELIKDTDGNVTGVRVDGEHVTRSKLRIETRLKLLAKWDPKKYGDKVAVGGSEDLPPIKTEDMTPTDRARLIVFALTKGLQKEEPK